MRCFRKFPSKFVTTSTNLDFIGLHTLTRHVFREYIEKEWDAFKSTKGILPANDVEE